MERSCGILASGEQAHMFMFSFSHFIRRNTIGLDISDSSIEALALNSKREIIAYGRIELPEGIIVRGKVLEKEKFAAKVRDLLLHTNPVPLLLDGMSAAISLPDTEMFMHRVEIPAGLSPEEAGKRVLAAAAKIIPFELHTLYHGRLEMAGRRHSPEEGKKESVLFIGAPRNSVQSYIDALRMDGISVAILEAGPIALARALFPPNYFERLARENNESVSAMILDIGAKVTSAHFFSSSGALALSVAAPVGGDNLTETIVKKFSVSREEAERLSRTVGFDYKNAGEKNIIVLQLQADIQKILREITEAVSYYERTSGERIAEVTLGGGAAVIPKIDEYLRMNLERNVKIGDPLQGLSGAAGIFKRESRPAILFGNVIGLALAQVLGGIPRMNLLAEESAAGERRHERAVIWIGWAALALSLVVFLSGAAYFFLFTEGEEAGEYVAPAEEALSTPPELIEDAQGDTLEVEEEARREVLIRETPTGWLNVRKEPDTGSEQMGRVLPGETHALLEEGDGWYKISILTETGEEEGWISAEYASIKSIKIDGE